MAELKLLSDVKNFGGSLKRYSHQSSETQCEMKFYIFLPTATKNGKVPALWFLAGLSSTDENFVIKSGAQRDAERLGIALIAPDTSPRGCNIEGESDSWDFGVGAGFYLDATQPKWSKNWRMYSYITKELPKIIVEHFPILENKQSICGHSMGGHGALVCALKNPGKYLSVSAFAPICNPIESPWGKKAFNGYLGDNQELWKEYDSTHLIQSYKGPDLHILIDQGTSDKFYHEKQLLPENLQKASNQVTIRMQEGYDHSYFFIASFIEEHLNHHAKHLKA